MKTLYLLRHAHAEDRAPAPLSDHERFLTPEGERAAAAVGAYMEKQHIFPDFVLSSSSVRTLQTVRLVYGRILKNEGQLVRSHFDRALYLAPTEMLLESIRATDDAVKTLLVAGHNPGLAELTRALSRGTLADHTTDFPPAALAAFRVNAKSWRELEPGNAELEKVFAP